MHSTAANSPGSHLLQQRHYWIIFPFSAVPLTSGSSQEETTHKISRKWRYFPFQIHSHPAHKLIIWLGHLQLITLSQYKVAVQASRENCLEETTSFWCWVPLLPLMSIQPLEDTAAHTTAKATQSPSSNAHTLLLQLSFALPSLLLFCLC